MTSREALQELFIRANGSRDAEEYTTSRLREIINTDLEVLDILKRYISYAPQKYGAFSLGFNDIKLTSEETNLLKDWLEDKNN